MNTKCNKEQFISKSIKLFGENAFDYSKVNYVNGYTEITLICKRHGEFTITPSKHLKLKGGCPKCSVAFRKKRRSMTTEEYKALIVEQHGNKYNLDKTEYNGMRNRVIAECPEHGEFSIIAYDFAHFRGCPKCGRLNKGSSKIKVTHTRNYLNTETFIQKARQIHGDKYDYSKVNYVNSNTKVCIICPEHGEFWQRPISHLKGFECSKCGKEKSIKSQTLNTEKWIEKARKVHSDKYDYSRVIYNGCYEKVSIICPEHGEFQQAAYSHLSGHGCPKCMCENNSKLVLSNTEDFISKSKNIHYYENNDYSEVEYKGAKIPVKIICEKGHIYWQMPNKHLSGHGCPYCVNIISQAEREITDFINSLGFETTTSTRSILSDSKELDIFIPSKNVAIEYNGLYWHDEIRRPDKNYHLNKTLECNQKGIRLIHIFEDEWNYKKEIVKSRLKNILGITTNKIYARKCEIKEIDNETSNKFLEENHIQGNINSSIRYGLYFNNELVSLMTFGKLRKILGQEDKEKEFELLRFCNKLDTNVVGGASKLLKHFKINHSPKSIISYADRRWNNGNLYEQIGFEYTHSSKSNYFYIIGNQRFNRFKFRKDILVKQGFDENKSEHEIMLQRGIYRIYDCGCLCYKWINNF